MKMPVTPPNAEDIFVDMIAKDSTKATGILSKFSPVDTKGRYLHWDKIQHLESPEGYSNKEWWAGIKFSRSSMYQTIPLMDKYGKPFKFCVPNNLQEELHWLDLNTAGTISAEKPIANPNIRNTYLIRSLVEEAISSSQLEGASTTRNVAKEMIRQGRDPKDKSEQMIMNNYHAMQFIREYKDEKLTPSIVLELHRIVTESTLDDGEKAGCFRDADEDIHVVDESHNVLHTPPDASELEDRLKVLCQFANGELTEDFLHPVIKAIVLHFMLAYDHPFVDGNGRTARALFYWALANQDYWLMEFISISKVIKRAPVQYGKAFLHTETDDNDLTYFIVHQLEVIKLSIVELQAYFDEKIKGVEFAESLLETNNKLKGKLNFRQLALLRHALKHPRFIYNINEHQNSHGIAYETARKDLIQMSDKLKLLTKLKSGKSFVFVSPTDIEDLIKNH